MCKIQVWFRYSTCYKKNQFGQKPYEVLVTKIEVIKAKKTHLGTCKIHRGLRFNRLRLWNDCTVSHEQLIDGWNFLVQLLETSRHDGTSLSQSQVLGLCLFGVAGSTGTGMTKLWEENNFLLDEMKKVFIVKKWSNIYKFNYIDLGKISSYVFELARTLVTRNNQKVFWIAISKVNKRFFKSIRLLGQLLSEICSEWKSQHKNSK